MNKLGDSGRLPHISEWLKVRDAAKHAQCGTRSIYLAVQQKQLRAARLGGRRELRFLREWIDEWLIESSKPVMVWTGTRGAGT